MMCVRHQNNNLLLTNPLMSIWMQPDTINTTKNKRTAESTALKASTLLKRKNALVTCILFHTTESILHVHHFRCLYIHNLACF